MDRLRFALVRRAATARPFAVAAALGLSLLLQLPCHGAEPECPPLQPGFPRGLQVRTAIGTGFFLGEVGRYSRPGLSVVLAADYEIFSFLAVEAEYRLGLNATAQPEPPAPGNFTTQAATAGLRLALPLSRFDLFLRGGVGLLWSGPDILVRVSDFDASVRLGWTGGLGVLYHTPRPRLFVGLDASCLGGVGFPGYYFSVNVFLGATLL
ncbi:MAG: hypothetical protein GYA21_02095 [Myxococcales bacterium]|nr:hypothetical protein [Myxococcales bacterium]